MGSHDATVFCDSQSDSICPSSGTNPQLCNRQKPPPHTHTLHNRTSSILYSWCDTGGLQLFHQLFATQRPSSLTERFLTLIYQSKGLYSTALLSSLWLSWPTRAFWHCFTSSSVVSWQPFCHIGQLHKVFSSQWILTYSFTILA